MQQVHISSL